jgi:hypothetical protein
VCSPNATSALSMYFVRSAGTRRRTELCGARTGLEGSNSSTGSPVSGVRERDAGGVVISRRARALQKKKDERVN